MMGVPDEFGAIFASHQATALANALEIQTMTEAFYYFASRLRDILRTHMPYLHKFESLGVRDVRHHLIEHPEKVSKIYRQSMVFGDVDGPKLKVGRTPDDPQGFYDRGLFVNAKEFETNLVAKLKAALMRSAADS